MDVLRRWVRMWQTVESGAEGVIEGRQGDWEGLSDNARWQNGGA